MSEGLSRIESVTQRLLVLTRDAPLDRRQTDLSGIVKDTVAFFSSRAARKKVRVTTDLSTPVNASVDVNRVSEALLNVLDNAADASSPGGKIVVRTTVENSNTREQRSACIDVIDDGTGIEPDELAKIFDPFYTTKAVGEGSGLGLAIARRVIEQHGGAVRVESAPGQGTRISLNLPTDLVPNEQEEE